MNTKDKILDSAQKLVQQRGFNGFSYADIADEVGIRKASLHHHFPTKADLGLTLIDNYIDQFDAALLKIDSESLPADKKLALYIDAYRCSLKAKRMCLGGILATEIQTLDKAMLPSLKQFFAHNTEWLTKVLKLGKKQKLFELNSSAEEQAGMILSTLQGALLLSRATGNNKSFEQTAASLLKCLLRKS